MEHFKCHLCDAEYESFKSMSQHYRVTHKLDRLDVRAIIYNEGVRPTCKCGCGEHTLWNDGESKFREFKHGHYVRTTGGFYSPDGARKSGETRKQRFEAGELQQWNKGKTYEETYGEERAQQLKDDISSNEERAKKISESLTGKPKTEEHVRKITEDRRNYWGDETHRLEQRERRMQYIIKNGFEVRSSLESLFADLMRERDIKFHEQFYVSEIPALYDFKIQGRQILIEVHGDYWHCKPGTKFEIPTYAAQISNLKTDKIKSDWARDNGYTLVIFWESDINNDPEKVLSELLSYIESE